MYHARGTKLCVCVLLLFLKFNTLSEGFWVFRVWFGRRIHRMKKCTRGVLDSTPTATFTNQSVG